MIELIDGMTLYHGSYIAIPDINLALCNDGLDFGKGFYLTSSYEQAISYVPASVRKNIRLKNIPATFDENDGQVSVYKFHADPSLVTFCFQETDINWLHFVAANRNHELFPALYEKYLLHDIVGGKVADDNTSRVLGLYVSGALGIPGTVDADRDAVRRLMPQRLQDQFCFRTDLSVMTLEYVRSDRYGDIKK